MSSGGSDSSIGYRSHGKRWCEPCQEEPLAVQVTCSVAVRLLDSTWLTMHFPSQPQLPHLLPGTHLLPLLLPYECSQHWPSPSQALRVCTACGLQGWLRPHYVSMPLPLSCLLLFLSSSLHLSSLPITEFKLLCRQNCYIKTQNTLVKSEYSLNPCQIKLYIIFTQFEIVLL